MAMTHRHVKVGLGAGLLLAAALAFPALADGERSAGKSYGAPTAAYASEPAYASWTGLYIGLGLGARSSSVDWTTTGVTTDAGGPFNGFQRAFPDSPVDRDFSNTGIEFNGFAGYNVQMQGVVFGIEGTLAGAGDSASKTQQIFPGAENLFNQPQGNTFDSIRASTDLRAGVRGRVGVLVRKDLLMYATGGWAYQQFNFEASCSGTLNNSSLCTGLHSIDKGVSRSGWTIGAGAEAQLTANWFARIEYSYSGLGSADLNYTFPGDVATNGETATLAARVNLDSQIGMVGVAYKF